MTPEQMTAKLDLDGIRYRAPEWRKIWNDEPGVSGTCNDLDRLLELYDAQGDALSTAKGERDRLLGKGREQVDEGAELIGTVGELREALATQPEGRSVVIHDGWDWPFWVNGDDSFDEVVLFIAHPDGVGCVNIDAVDDLYDALSTAKGETEKWIEAAKYEQAEKFKAWRQRNAANLERQAAKGERDAARLALEIIARHSPAMVQDARYRATLEAPHA